MLEDSIWGLLKHNKKAVWFPKYKYFGRKIKLQLNNIGYTVFLKIRDYSENRLM